MIPISRKFPMRTSFIEFRRHANRLSTPLTTIYYQPTRSSPRLSIVIPKKINNKATTRNWLKRISYRSAWAIIKDWKLDVVVVYKPLPLKKSIETKEKIINDIDTISQKLS